MKFSEIDSGIYQPVLTATLEDLPELRFNSNIPDLKVAMDSIQECLEIRLPGSELPINSDARKASNNESIVADTVRIYNALKKCPEHECYFNVLEKLADELGNSVNNVFTTLTSGVKPDVDNLKTEIYNTAEEIVNKNNKKIKTNNGIKIDYRITDFDSLFAEYDGREELKEMIESEFGYAPSPIISSIRMLLAHKAIRVSKVELDDETWKEGCARLDVKGNEEDIFFIKKLLTSPFDAASFVTNTVKLTNEDEGYAKFYDAMTTNVRNLMNVFTQVSSIVLNINPVTESTLSENIKKVRNIFALLTYVGFIVEEDLKKNRTLIMSYDLLYEGFVDKYKDAVGSFETVSKYLKVRYINSGRTIPPSGIRIDRVIEDVKDIETEFNTNEIAENIQAVSIRRNALRSAAIEVFTNYLANTPESRLPKGVPADKFVNSKNLTIRKYAGKIEVNSIESDNVEDVVYNFIVDIWYSNTPVEFAYKLGIAEVLSQMSISPELNNNACDIIDASIGSTIISDFILKNLVVDKK